MKNKIFSIIFVIVFVLSSVSFAYATARPTIFVESTTAKPGETIVLSVIIENNPGINTFSLGFDYDRTALSLEKVEVSEKLAGQFAYKTKAVWLNGKDINYNGEIVLLTFKVLSSAEVGDTKVGLTYSPGDISNYNEENVNFNTTPGTVTIEQKNSALSSIIALFKKLIALIRDFFA